MLSKLQKISKDLILYSVLVSNFEKLDFKNDALAGVRANYFNAKCSPQVEKTEISFDSRTHLLSYSMKRHEPLSWKMMLNQRPVQTVKRSADGGYCVMSYGDNGIIYKRQFFDKNHFWLRSEYYNRELENQISAVIYPRTEEGLVILRLQQFTQSGIENTDLYPSLKAPRKRCDALIYSNSGMIWYDARFETSDNAQEEALQTEAGFTFTKEAFMSANSSDVLDLQHADYLSESDLIVSEPAEETEPVVPETQTYSAYDKIESILFEAHKTNKNIFGELANHSVEEPEEVIEEAEPLTEEAAVTETVTAEEIAEVEETEETDTEPEIAVEISEEPEPETVIQTKSGEYAYYGDTDENGKRSGVGRTVTPNGLTAYEGSYCDDKRHGFGVCYYKEGSPNYIGDWDMGNRSGRGVGYRLSDSTMHVGKWIDNKPDGFGARFDKDGGFIDVCTYVNGKRNGKSVSFDEDGNVVIKIWKDGEAVSEKIVSD